MAHFFYCFTECFNNLEWTVLPNTDSVGSDKMFVPPEKVKVSECAKLCKNDRLCNGFIHNGKAERCQYFKYVDFHTQPSADSMVVYRCSGNYSDSASKCSDVIN